MSSNNIDVFQEAQNGNIAKIKQALINGLNINITREVDANQTMLHYATNNGNFELVKFLIGNKINVDIEDKHGATALHKAARKGFVSIVKILIENGAQVDIQNKQKATPFNKAIYDNQIECAEFLLKNGANIDNHYDSNYDQSITSLMFAVGGSHEYSKNLVKFLVKNGAKSDVKDSNDNLLLTTAIEQNTLTAEVVKAASNINIQDKNGKTALHHAASCDSISPLKKIIKHNLIDFNILDNNGRTPLYYSKNETRASFLIKSGASYDKTKKYDNLFWSLYGEQHIDLNKLNELIASGKEEKFETNTMAHQITEVIKDFAKKHQDETFYVFAIEEGNSLCLNSEEAFDKTLKRYQTKYPKYYSEKDDIERLKFNTGDFEYQGFSYLNEGFVHHDYEEYCCLSSDEQTSSNYSVAMDSLIKELIDKNVFKFLTTSKDFKIIRVDHTY